MKDSVSKGDIPAVAGLLVAYAAAVILMSRKLDPTQWGALDAEVFHLPQINWFIEWGNQWHYPAWSASGPGFHWLMAVLARLTGADALDQTSWQCLFGPAMLTGMALLFFYAALRRSGARPLRALVVGFPLVTSSYFWTPALHPVSECLSMVGFFAMAYALAARRPLVFSVAAAAATVARQNFFSAAGAYGLMAVVEEWPRIFNWRMIWIGALTLTPSFMVVAELVTQWGGLTPPEWQDVHVAPSLGPVLHAVMLVGVFGWLFLRREDLADTPRARIRLVAIVAMLALALWLIIPEDGGDRPNSIVWKAAALLPSFHGRPLLTLPLLAVGMVVLLAYWWRGWRDGYRLSPELALFICYFAAQAAQRFSWQRYAEVPVLLLLSLGMARVRKKSPVEDGIMLLAFGAYLVLTILRMTEFF